MHLGPLHAEPALQILFVADEHVRQRDDAAELGDGVGRTAAHGPQLLAVVEIEARDGAGRTGSAHALEDELGRALRERREDAARVKPAHARGKNGAPVDVTRTQQRRRSLARL